MSTLSLDRFRADILALLEDAPDNIADDDNLIDLGLDSMRAMNLALAWEEAGIGLDFADITEAPTIAELWERAQARQQSSAP